jgi:hypothetical protein
MIHTSFPLQGSISIGFPGLIIDSTTAAIREMYCIEQKIRPLTTKQNEQHRPEWGPNRRTDTRVACHATVALQNETTHNTTYND